MVKNYEKMLKIINNLLKNKNVLFNCQSWVANDKFSFEKFLLSFGKLINYTKP